MEFEVAISFFIGGKNMRHIGEKIILVLCIAVFGIAAMNLVEIGKEYYDGQKEYEELKEYTEEPKKQAVKMDEDWQIQGQLSIYDLEVS